MLKEKEGGEIGLSADFYYNTVNKHEKRRVPANTLHKLQISCHCYVPYDLGKNMWRHFSEELCNLGIGINLLEIQLEVKKMLFIAVRCHYGNRAVSKSHSATIPPGSTGTKLLCRTSCC